MESLRYVKKMKYDCNARILVLLELMSEDGRLAFVKRFLGCNSAAFFAEGKIWVLWDLPLTITFNTFADQLVDMSSVLQLVHSFSQQSMLDARG